MGGTLVIAALVVIFAWPMVVGAYLAGGLANLVEQQREIASPWRLIWSGWILLVLSVGLAQVLKWKRAVESIDVDEESDSGAEGYLGTCPNCGNEIEQLTEKSRNDAMMESVRKCPECDAILGII
ncbi:MAG: hypothetical protein ABEI52_03735 [Halobacteriaceae archaeon]